MRFQLSHNGVRTVDCSYVPSERQHIAPVAISMKQGLEQNVVRLRESSFELRKPILRSRGDGFCSSSIRVPNQSINLHGVSSIFLTYTD